MLQLTFYKNILLWLFIFLNCWLSGQQIILNEPPLVFSENFDSRYTEQEKSYVQLNALPLFKEKHIRKINIYNADGQLSCFFELDRAGKIIGEGYDGRYYFRTIYKKQVGTNILETRAWYQGSLLMRSDSTLRRFHLYQSGDTLMEYSGYDIQIYKRGGLINAQNAFYNWKYLSPPDTFKTDYDSTTLFLCRREHHNTKFTASVRNGQVSLDTAMLSANAFYRNFRQSEKTGFFVEGESFTEPPEASKRFCGTVLPHEEIEEVNADGLFERCYISSMQGRWLSCYALYEYYEKH